jgi:membrane-bound lytic murein transglycosylase B
VPFKSYIRIWLGVATLVLSVCSTAVVAQQQGFEQWLGGLREEALSKGISATTFDRAFKGVAPIPRVIELDRKQPEFTLTLDQYLSSVVPLRRVIIGRHKLAENRKLLDKVAAKYGVQPRFIVAFWGIETDYGRLTGGYSVIAAIATLAYDGRRSDFFRSQLLDALQILEEGHVEPEEMIGSWAGAMGQAQFMPSTFRAYAVDFDGDGHINLWSSRADVFASAANYLSRVGWNSEQTWGREVKVPKGLDPSLFGLDLRKSLHEWNKLGVRRVNGKKLPKVEISASLIKPDEDSKGGRTYLVYDNYRAIMHWNRSHKFAVAVGTLADKIRR